MRVKVEVKGGKYSPRIMGILVRKRVVDKIVNLVQ